MANGQNRKLFGLLLNVLADRLVNPPEETPVDRPTPAAMRRPEVRPFTRKELEDLLRDPDLK